MCGRCVRELEAIEFPLADVSGGGGWFPMRLANDRELPGIWSRSTFLDFCRGRFDDAVEAADDEGCLDEPGAGMPGRGPAGEYADAEGPCGLGFGLGLMESCLIRATGTSWRGGALGMELAPLL